MQMLHKTFRKLLYIFSFHTRKNKKMFVNVLFFYRFEPIIFFHLVISGNNYST